MEFYTCSKEKRPVRLTQSTRKFAWESLHGKYGDEAVKYDAVSMDMDSEYDGLDQYGKYDACIRKIAMEAPLRILEEEKICGAATLGRAIRHEVPAVKDGKAQFPGVSHTTLGFDRVLEVGMDGILAEIKEYQRLYGDNRVRESMCRTIESMRIWHGRYMEAEKESHPDIYEALKKVPFGVPETFREAVQSLWFAFAFTRLCGTWPGIGRIDEMLGGFLEEDLRQNRITLEEAREILAHFFIKGCEWICSGAESQNGSGDAQHYQNLVLSGIDKDGNQVTNLVTYLVLDVVEELGISDFPITVRVSERTEEKLLKKVAQVMKHGGGVVAVYNEDLILRSLENFGYDKIEARSFANDGCWEITIPGKTCFSYAPFDALQILLRDVLLLEGEIPPSYETYEELYQAFYQKLKQVIASIVKDTRDRLGSLREGKWEWKEAFPCSVPGVFVEGCAKKGRSYFGGGPVYTVLSPHIGGAPDVGNSLYAIHELVYKEKRITLQELWGLLKNNWEGGEVLRQYALNHFTYYGNDQDEGDSYTVRVLNDFGDMVREYRESQEEYGGILFPPGVSTFGRQIEWAPYRAAVPFGRKKGEILSGNTSPTPGTDAEGATAVIKSYCKADLERLTCGAALDVKLFPATVSGEEGVDALCSLIKGFMALGGFFMQLDVMDGETLKKAQENPEEYKTLSVRVSGWNARFVTLDREWQQMIIERTQQGM